jgi:hypothetical protein
LPPRTASAAVDTQALGGGARVPLPGQRICGGWPGLPPRTTTARVAHRPPACPPAPVHADPPSCPPLLPARLKRNPSILP